MILSVQYEHLLFYLSEKIMTTLSYHISFERYYDHLVRVHLAFTAPTDSPTLWLPTWIAGSYLVREFSKHIAQVHYTTNDITHLAKKSSKNTYMLAHAHQGDNVHIFYDVYCHDLSVRTAFVDSTRLFGNFTSLLMMVTGLEQHNCQITLSIPHAFLTKNPHATLAIGLPYDTLHHDDGIDFILNPVVCFDSYDYPFEISTQTHFEFTVQANERPIRHRFFIAGRHNTDTNRLAYDVKRICQSYVDWLGDVPFDNYTFMTMATGSEYGGLEHINSTALITPRTDLPNILENIEPSADYQRFLGLCSHEYFHAWWVKSVRADVMMDNDLTTESYTPLLWVFEGFTSYIDDLMLLRSGVISKDSYLSLLNQQISRYAKTDGKAYQSVAESSFDAWIKLYRPDENTTNQGISYYNKGALVALLLDFMLIEHGYRLFDVVKHFYELSKTTPNKRYGLTTDALGKVIGGMMGADKWQAFYDDYVIGTADLPIKTFLNRHHIITTPKIQAKIWGMTCTDESTGLKISHLQRNSIASQAGLSVGDTIIAIDGIKANKDLLNRATLLARKSFTSVCIHIFRRDELMVLDVKMGKDLTHTEYTLSGDGGVWLNFS